jgi:dTDP-4-dehydrorhamnose 3,5-epimerase
MPNICAGGQPNTVAEFRELGVPGLFEIRPNRIADARGYFCETWRRDWSLPIGFEGEFVQDNQSLSRDVGVLRGLHLQRAPAAQAKLVRVVRGAIFDVAVDLRPGSPTYGQWAGLIVSADLGNQIFVPAGFAHGFLTLEADCEVAYKVSAPYSPEDERAVRFDDPAIGIQWPDIGTPFILSDKDRAAPLLKDSDLDR